MKLNEAVDTTNALLLSCLLLVEQVLVKWAGQSMTRSRILSGEVLFLSLFFQVERLHPHQSWLSMSDNCNWQALPLCHNLATHKLVHEASHLPLEGIQGWLKAPKAVQRLQLGQARLVANADNPYLRMAIAPTGPRRRPRHRYHGPSFRHAD
jgi:hypothetical protein